MASKYCVEIGAWDGIKGSNTRNLVVNHGFSGTMIEGDRNKFLQLRKNYKDYPSVSLVNQHVAYKGDTSLDAVLGKVHAPEQIDYISIDVDGLDYYFWKYLVKFNPSIVVIEYNPAIPNNIVYVQDCDPDICQGCSLLALILLGKSKGYELVCTTRVNAFFVRKEFFDFPEIANNSIEYMHDDSELTTQIFQLYDGTIKMIGYDTLLWHDVPLVEEDIQILPASMRRNPWKVYGLGRYNIG
jgi:hypothetical protein